MKTRNYILSLVAVLLVGIFIGHLGTRMMIKKRIRHVKRHYEHPAEPFKKALNSLGLTENQRESTDSLLQVYGPKIHRLRQESRDSARKLHGELEKELARIFTAEQMKVWEKQKHHHHGKRKLHKRYKHKK